MSTEADILEGIFGYIKSVAERQAEMCDAVVAMSEASVIQADAAATLRSKFVEMHDEQREMNARLTAWLDEQAKEKDSIRRLRHDHDKFVSEVRERLPKVASGQR